MCSCLVVCGFIQRFVLRLRLQVRTDDITAIVAFFDHDCHNGTSAEYNPWA